MSTGAKATGQRTSARTTHNPDSPSNAVLYRRILGYLRPYGWLLVASTLATLGFAAFDSFSFVMIIPFLQALTGGQGRYTLAFSHYEPVPPSVQAQLAAQYKPRDDS